MKTKTKIFSILILIVATLGAAGQQGYTISKERSSVTVSGTSSLHDWDMKLNQFEGIINLDVGNPAVHINTVNFKGSSKSLKSNSSIMDNKTQNALKTDKYPEIRFKASTTKSVSLNNKQFDGVLMGELFIAGQTNMVGIPFTGKLLADNRIEVTGSTLVKMSDFSINPPTAMLGSLKTGDEVTISFTLVLNRE